MSRRLRTRTGVNPRSVHLRPVKAPDRLGETCVSLAVRARTVARRLGKATALLALLALLSSPAGAAATKTRPSRISFSPPPAKVIDRHTQLVVKPAVIPLFLDGQWFLEHLRWKGWGSRVARATGISNSSNG